MAATNFPRTPLPVCTWRSYRYKACEASIHAQGAQLQALCTPARPFVPRRQLFEEYSKDPHGAMQRAVAFANTSETTTAAATIRSAVDEAINAAKSTSATANVVKGRRAQAPTTPSADSPTFTITRVFTCADWVGRDCAAAASSHGYTSTQVARPPPPSPSTSSLSSMAT